MTQTSRLTLQQRNIKTTQQGPGAYTLKTALHPPPHQQQVGGREVLLCGVLFGESMWTWRLLPRVGESREAFYHSLLGSGASVGVRTHGC